MGKVQASACPFSASEFENSTVQDLGKAPVATSMEGKGVLKRITTDSKRRPENEKIRRTLNKVGVSREKVWIPRRIRAACLRSERTNWYRVEDTRRMHKEAKKSTNHGWTPSGTDLNKKNEERKVTTNFGVRRRNQHSRAWCIPIVLLRPIMRRFAVAKQRLSNCREKRLTLIQDVCHWITHQDCSM